MNLFFTLLRRRAVLFGLLAVLLAAVIAFYCIAFSALDAVQTQRAAVSGQCQHGGAAQHKSDRNSCKEQDYHTYEQYCCHFTSSPVI